MERQPTKNPFAYHGDTIQGILSGAIKVEPVGQTVEQEPHRYQVTLYLTDHEMKVLNTLVSNEAKRVQRELSKLKSSKSLWKLECLSDDLRSIQATMNDNTW